MARLIELTQGERRRYVGAVLAMAGASALLFAAPLVAMVAIDGFLTEEAEVSPAWAAAWVRRVDESMSLAGALGLAAGVAFAVTVAAGGLQYLRGRWAALASEAIVQRLRDRLYAHLHAIPTSEHDRADTGDLVQRCTSDVETVRVFLAAQVTEIGRSALLVLSAVPVMLWIDSSWTLVSLALFPVILGFSLFFFRRIQRTFLEADEAEASMTSVLQENLTAVRVVRAFSREPFEVQRFARRNADHRASHARLMNLLAWFWGASDLLCLLQVSVAYVVGAWRVDAGWLTLGQFFAFTMSLNLMIWPFRHMGRVLADTGKALVSLKRLDEVLSVEPEVGADEAAAEEPRLRGALKVKDLRLSFDGETPVLDGVSFEVAPGETVALVGPPGSGKSTLLHALLRLYEIPRGTVWLDGVDLLDVPRRAVRQQSGVVLQEPFLYSRSIAENLRWGRDDATDAEIHEAACDAAVHQDIDEFDRGYETLVGERGVTLSGGQRQRVALARALLRKPAFLFLDDAFSAVDTETESTIVDALRRRMGSVTTLLVSQRLSTLRHADRILVFERGRIVAEGTHEQLVERDGPYQRLWRIQSALEARLKSPGHADAGTPEASS